MCQDCDYQDYIDKCDEILTCEKLEWCHETTEGIKTWIEDNSHITEKQRDAIDSYMNKLAEVYY